MQQNLLRVMPCQAGVDTAGILAFLDEVEQKQLSLHSLMVMRRNKVVAEGWWAPYRSAYNHMLFSLSKSFTSTALGFAVGEGLLTLDDPVLKFFEGKLPAAPCENMQKMQVRHLIGMCTGHTVEPALRGEDWAYQFLTSYVPLQPGSQFLYNTAATYMVSVILQKVTGQKVSEYLQPRLFEPLGIADIWWETCPMGYETGGFGLNIKTEDIARFGIFLLNRGMYNGKQLIDPAWIDEATARHISNGDIAVKSDWTQGYGYQFWRCQPEGVYRGDGAFGQYCIVMPRQDAVVAITSGLDDMQSVLNAVWAHLLPAMRDDAVCEKQLNEQLKQRLQNLCMPLPQGDCPCCAGKEYSGLTYALDENELGLLSARFDFGKTTTLTLATAAGKLAVNIGHGAWVDNEPPAGAAIDSHRGLALPYAHGPVSAAGAWQNGVYTVKLVHNRTPFTDTLQARFVGSGVVLTCRRNVALSGPNAAVKLFGLRKD